MINRFHLAGRITRRVRSLALPRAVILLYHRVADVTYDPQLLCVSPARFSEHLSVIGDHCRPTTLNAVAQAIAERQVHDRAVAITFDDGYLDNLVNAKPLLSAADIPATVFVTTAYVGTTREFWWDELERLLLMPKVTPPLLQIRSSTHNRCWSTRTSAERLQVYGSIHGWIRPMPADEIDCILCQIRHWAGDAGYHRPSHRVMSVDEIAELGHDGLVEVGAHTRHHVSLARQPTAVQRDEIAGSRRDLEQWLNRPITSFSYPYGSPNLDFDRGTVSVVREAGFNLTTANFPACVTRLSDVYQLPRFLVRNWDGDEFARRLERFLASV